LLSDMQIISEPN